MAEDSHPIRSGLRMLKRSWSSNENVPPPQSSPPVIDLCSSPPRPEAKHRKICDAPLPARPSPFHIPPRKADGDDDDFLPLGDQAPLMPRSRSSSPVKTSNINALVKPLMGARSRSSTPQIPTSSVPTSPEKRTIARVFLSPEQQSVLEAAVKHGKNVFFTGSAGAGKSYLLRQMIHDLHAKYSKSSGAVAITASTGIAACNIGGITLHSFSGVGIGTGTVEQLCRYVRRNRNAVTRWKKTSVLVIDEVSMIDPKLFEKLECVARHIRQSVKPFGGIQIIMSGDFFQLPPVSQGATSFVFESPTWSQVIEQKFNLTQVFRQRDQQFVNMLNDMRLGKLAPETIQAFSKLERTPSLPEGIVPTELYAVRSDVDKANQMRLDALQTEMRTYTSLDDGSLPPDQLQRTLENFMPSRRIALKKGAQVMLIKNVDRELSNGSVGTVLDFVDDESFKELYGEEDAPDTLLRAERAPGATRQVSKTEPRPAPRWPLVRFHLVNGRTRDFLARPEAWKTEEPSGKVVASRTQVPLILAWAMSIHKSQGQTLQYCRIDLRRVFEKGQAYVALSRATSLDGLQVIGFHPSKVMAHPKVIAWNRQEFAT